MTFEWERSAYNGDPIPPGLSFLEHTAYLTLREIYRQYRIGAVTRDVAAKDKQKMIYEYECELRKYSVLQKAGEKSVKAWLEAETLVDAYNREKTIELADKIINLIFGK